MIALWAAYATAIGALLTLGAEGLDGASRAARLPGRWVWLGAVVATIAAPLLVNAFAAPAARALALAYTPGGVAAGLTIDDFFLIAWAMGSLLVSVMLARAACTLWRDGRTWHDTILDGVAVRETVNAGPAVVGVSRMRIVVPAWVRTLDAHSRSLVLRHEMEHAAARDPLLIALGGLALVVMPWNVALWCQVRRLRLAIEIDCDRRVLRREPDARAYALVLLASSERMSSISPALPACLATPRRSLEPRILAMTANRSMRGRIATGAAGCAAAIIAIAVACDTPHPNPMAPTSSRPDFGRMGDIKASREVRLTGDTVILREPHSDRAADQNAGAEEIRRLLDRIEPLGRDDQTLKPGDTVTVLTRDGRTMSAVYRPVRPLMIRDTIKDSQP